MVITIFRNIYKICQLLLANQIDVNKYRETLVIRLKHNFYLKLFVLINIR